MTNNLTRQVRPDYTGKMVARWVKDEVTTSTTSLPAPRLGTTKKSAPEKKRPVKLTPKQATQSVHYGMERKNVDRDAYAHGVRRPLSDELESIPFDERQSERGRDGWYRFPSTEADFYAVLSVVRPMDAFNLLHRGIRSADDAYNFLADNGVEHLAGDHSALMDELMRQRVEPHQAAPYLDDMLDAGADPKNAADWIKLTTASQNLRNATDEVKDDMLSGAVTFAEMKSMGMKNLDARSIPEFAKYIKLAKTDGNPNFTVDDISAVSKIHADVKAPTLRGSYLETMLGMARFHGSDAVNEIRDHVDPTHHVRVLAGMKADGGEVDEKLLSDLTLYRSRLKKHRVFLMPEHDSAVAMLFKEGFTPEQVGNYMNGAARKSTETDIRISALRKGISSSINDGWL